MYQEWPCQATASQRRWPACKGRRAGQCGLCSKLQLVKILSLSLSLSRMPLSSPDVSLPTHTTSIRRIHPHLRTHVLRSSTCSRARTAPCLCPQHWRLWDRELLLRNALARAGRKVDAVVHRKCAKLWDCRNRRVLRRLLFCLKSRVCRRSERGGGLPGRRRKRRRRRRKRPSERAKEQE